MKNEVESDRMEAHRVESERIRNTDDTDVTDVHRFELRIKNEELRMKNLVKVKSERMEAQ